MSHRVERFASTLKHVVAGIIANDINDPILKKAAISEIIIEPDLRKARIFITSASGDLNLIMEHLDKAKGYIKRAVGKQMYLRYVPELIFIKEPTFKVDLDPNDDPSPPDDRSYP